MSHHIIEATDLHYVYPDGTAALEGVSFRITHGESVAIVGANGAGKSTLLLHFNGHFLASKGALNVGGCVISKKTVPIARRAVGMTFQNPDDQLFMPTVFEDVAFGPLNLDLPADEIERRVEQALQIVGAAHLRNRPPYRLSGGEKRAVAIATVLSMSPDILVMDEPTSNLDPKARTRLIALLKTFTHSKIIATHDLDMALDVCERTLILKRGRVIADGPTSRLLLDERLLEEAGLEKPLRVQGCPICSASNR
jgi:cobalt/nickel transport system ATP-binding protein